MTKGKEGMNPTLRVAKSTNEKGIVTLSSGYKGRIHPVSAKLIDEVASTIPSPEVPKQFIEAKGREEYNPLDPEYQRAVADADRQRGLAVTEALVMFGVELVDAVPPVDTWLPKLQYMAKRGRLDLTAFDLLDPMDLEFLFKNYIAVATPDLVYVSMASGLTSREVSQAVAGFPGNKVRSANRGNGAEA
jgi:hypothetical protein